MSTSASLTRLMLWPNSVTSSSAVSWSITSLTVTGMPILNSDLTRSAARSAMRLASSPTVIASGTTTSRTCLAEGPACIWARFSFSRERLSAARRARAGVAVLAQGAADGELAALAAMLVAAAAGARGLGALGRGMAVAVAGAGRARHLPRPARLRRGRLGRRFGGAASLLLGGEARGFGRLLLGLAILLGAALLVLGLRPWPACPRGGGPPRARRGARPRPRAAISPAIPCARRRRRPAARRASARRARARARPAPARLGRGSGFGASASPGRRKVRAFLVSTITVFERPWLKLCFTLPTSTVRLRPSGARAPSFGLSVVSLTQNPSFTSTAEAPGVSAVAALSPSSRPIKARHRPSAWPTRAAAARSMMAACTTFSRPSANDNMALSAGKTSPCAPLPSSSRPTRQAWSSLRRPSSLASAAWSSSAHLAAPGGGLDLLASRAAGCRRAPRGRAGRAPPGASAASIRSPRSAGAATSLGLERPRQRALQLALGLRRLERRRGRRRSRRRAPARARARPARPAPSGPSARRISSSRAPCRRSGCTCARAYGASRV